MLDTYSIVTTVVAAHFLALISPGPDFLLVVRSAIRNTPRRAIGVAIGIALANALYIALCIIGVGSIIARSFYLMIALKILGGAFLLYVAYHALKAKRSDYDFLAKGIKVSDKKAPSFMHEFMLGIISGLSNPKNIIFYLSLFSVVLTPQVSTALTVWLGIWMSFIVFAWDGMIIFVLLQNHVRKAFGKIAFYIDKVAGALLGILGVKLLSSAMQRS